jgi:Bacterial dnaA protein helix-turn-helix
VRRRVDAVLREVAGRYELRPGDLTSSGHGDRSAQLARHLAVYIAREETGASYPVLGRMFGRDHTTILHSCRLVRDQLAADADLAREVRAIRDTLSGGAVLTAPASGNEARAACGGTEDRGVDGPLPVTPRRPFGWWCRECGTYTAVDDEDLCERCAPGAGAATVQLLVACQCPCGRRLQAARPVLAEAAIRCGRCGGDFTARAAGEGRR